MRLNLGHISSRLLGVLVSYIDSRRSSELVDAVSKVAHRRGYDIVLGTTEGDATQQQEVIRRWCERGIAGLLAVPVETDAPVPVYTELVSEGFPVCLMDRGIPDLETDAVLTDNEGAGYLATRYLIQQGHQRIAIISRPMTAVRRARVRGYRQALQEAGLAYSPRDVFSMLQLPSVTLVSRFGPQIREDVADLRCFLEGPEPYTAIISLQPASTFELREALKVIKWQIPDDLLLLVIGSSHLITDGLGAEVPRVDLSQQEIGRIAAERLIDRVEGLRTTWSRDIVPAQYTQS